MNGLIEYFYCLIYALAMTVCVYKYLERKPKWNEVVLFVLFYGLVNYFITDEIQINLKYKIIINILTILSDFVCICILNRKMKLYLFFFTSLFISIYSQCITIITYPLNYIDSYLIQMSLNASFVRFVIVLLINFCTIVTIKCFEKKQILPQLTTVKENYKILCLTNLLVQFIMSVFQSINELNQGNVYLHIMSLIFVALWLILIYALNRSFMLAREKENYLIMQSTYGNIEQYIKQYEYEENQMKKIRHDIKNHLTVIKNLDETGKISRYVDQLYPELENIKVISKKISGNIYIDTILNSKMFEFKNVSIISDFEINNLKMGSVDLSVILFNLIDNACQSAEEINGQVSIKMKYTNTHLFIEIENDCIKKPDFISKKGKGHGYGMRIIDDIIKKYNGNIEYEIEETKVRVKVGLIV